MAIRALNSLIVANYDTAASASWLAGAALVRDLSNPGRVVIGTRTAVGSSTGFVGFSADDTARTGNTMILADPVGSSYVDSSGVLQANNNGFYAVSKRAIGDYLAENVNTVTNPTAGSSGYEGPRRGVGVYNTPGAQFITDQFLSGSGSSATNIFTDGSAAVYNPGTPLTFAANGSGKLVEAGSLFVGGFAGTHPNLVVGFVDRYDSAAGLLYFTQR
jgi:hypothetical protein